MKHIGFLISNMNNSGGTERVTSIIANGLIANGFQVSILSLIGSGEPFFKLRKEISVEYLYKVKPSFYKSYFDCSFKIRSFVKTNYIDVLIVVDSIQCLFSSLALYGLNVKHICWEHFNFTVNDDGKNIFGYKLQLRKLARIIASRVCDDVITLTEKDKKLWEMGLKSIQTNIKAISNPSPYENIKNFPKLEHKTVVTVGRLTYQKSFDLLLEAWKKVYSIHPDWTLQIIGSGEDESNLKLQAKELGIDPVVQFIPVTSNIITYYENASFYCMSSRFEGLPMVLLEAQAFGLPIVSFDCNTGPSDLIDQGENGYLVECYDTNKLADSIIQMIEITPNKYNSMCLNAKKKNEEYYFDSIFSQWIELLGS